MASVSIAAQIYLVSGNKNIFCIKWRQIVADIFNCEVRCMVIEEAAAYGAMLQSMWAYYNITKRTTICDLTDKFIKLTKEVYTPIETNVEKYNSLYKIQTQISNCLQEIFQLDRKYLIKFT